ncbi:hypothetical protein Tco_1070975 [Tanacetum coccineum]|uniref:Uncharacterized protein n=1 Tax=Tanacetum coccineum TaxID=301880 RepID=A0ABQ5HQ37_9ASTR
MSSSTVTYKSISSDSDLPQRGFHLMDPAEFEAAPSPDYVPGLEHPPSLDYLPDPEEPEQEPLILDYVPKSEYPEYLVPSDVEVPIEDQPLPVNASPVALSSDYVANSDLKEDPKEDPEEDPADYPADGGDDDDESFDDDDDVEEQKAFEDDDEEEHSALADSSAVPVDDPVPPAEDTKAFETDESAPILVPLPRRRTARISIPLLPLSVPSPPLPLPSPPTHTSPTYTKAPLGYRASRIWLKAASPPTHHLSKIPSPPMLLPSTTHRDDITKADMSLQKKARFSALTSKFEVGESLVVAATRQAGHALTSSIDYGFIDTVDATPGRPMSREVGYGIEDVWDEMIRDMKERTPTIVAGLSQRVTNLSTNLARDTHEIYVRLEDPQDNRAL